MYIYMLVQLNIERYINMKLPPYSLLHSSFHTCYAFKCQNVKIHV